MSTAWKGQQFNTPPLSRTHTRRQLHQPAAVHRCWHMLRKLHCGAQAKSTLPTQPGLLPTTSHSHSRPCTLDMLVPPNLIGESQSQPGTPALQQKVRMATCQTFATGSFCMAPQTLRSASRHRSATCMPLFRQHHPHVSTAGSAAAPSGSRSPHKPPPAATPRCSVCCSGASSALSVTGAPGRLPHSTALCTT